MLEGLYTMLADPVLEPGYISWAEDRFHNPVLADPVKAPQYVESEWQPDKVRLRYDWLFEYDATRLPIPA